jgi:uncharacterized membrane protein
MEKPKLDNLSGISLALGILSVGTAVLCGFGLPTAIVLVIALVGIVISIIALVKNQKHGALALSLCILSIIIVVFMFEYNRQKAIDEVQKMIDENRKTSEQMMKELGY